MNRQKWYHKILFLFFTMMLAKICGIILENLQKVCPCSVVIDYADMVNYFYFEKGKTNNKSNQGWASVLFKRTERSLRSFPFFIKEQNDLCVLFRSL